ncbi:MAG: hypothetical protein WAK71_09790 [Streptosporangiaceae bacterium]
MLDDDGLHSLGLRLACLGVGRQDLVAGFELADGDSGAGGEQDLRGRGEAVITASVDGIAVGGIAVGGIGAGVFCGKGAIAALTNSMLQPRP